MALIKTINRNGEVLTPRIAEGVIMMENATVVGDVAIGEGTTLWFNAVLRGDVNTITIGDRVLIGPRTGLYTAGHPIAPEVRDTGLEYGLPITLEDGVWLGGSVAVCPGVTIGQNSIIAAGSVVTKDIPPNVIAAGNPCRVLRPITDEDREKWEAQRREYLQSQERG